MKASDRRVRVRVPIQFKVNCSHDESNYLISYSKDISVEGMYVCTEKPFPVGTYLKLIFSIGDLHEMAVSAKVIWVNQEGPTQSSGMGVQFLSPPPVLQETILQIVRRVAVLERDEDIA